MDHIDTRAPTLFDLIARQWQRPAAACAATFNSDGTAVAFAGSDGSLAIVATADAEPPDARIHTSIETGRMTIRPRRLAIGAPVVVEPLGAGVVPIARHGRNGFVAGCGDGRICRITALGKVETLDTRLDGPIAAVASDAGGERIACSAGGVVCLTEQDDSTPALCLDHDTTVTALAFSQDGSRLAAVHGGGATVWRLTDVAEREGDFPFAGTAAAANWSPDDAWLAVPLSRDGFRLIRIADGAARTVGSFPGSVRDVVFNRRAGALVSSGAFRAATWSMANPPIEDERAGAMETGRAGFVVADRLASHPTRDLVAVGFSDGLLTVAQIGRRDELSLQPEGDGAASALTWSGDGRHLAVGTAAGAIAIVTFPTVMLK